MLRRRDLPISIAEGVVVGSPATGWGGDREEDKEPRAERWSAHRRITTPQRLGARARKPVRPPRLRVGLGGERALLGRGEVQVPVLQPRLGDEPRPQRRDQRGEEAED